MLFGSSIIHLTTVDSTNNYAAKLLKENLLSSGAVILADVQTAGKGQRGAQWEAKAGENLLFSVVLRHVNMSVGDQFVLNQLSALAITDFLGKIGISAKLKWPNDVFVGDKKIAGILVETNVSGAQIKDVIIGIGLNVNQSDFNDLRATSIFLEGGSLSTIDEVLNELLKGLTTRWLMYQKEGKDLLLHYYLENLLGYQELRNYTIEGNEVEGKIEGLDEWGRLLLKIGSETKAFDLKEISYCW